MDEFKIGDSIEENVPSNLRKRNKTIAIIIVCVLSIFMGLFVYLISNSFMKDDKNVEVLKDEPLEISDQNVKILYNYVTFGINNTRYDKLVKESNVTLSSFSNYERFFYALQFARSGDFESTDTKDDKNNTIYFIETSTLQEYMIRFFGSEVTYTNDIEIPFTFKFRVNNKNTGTLKYNPNNSSFEIAFTELKNDTPNELVKPFYTKLDSAVRKVDGSIEINEKVIYTKIEKINNVYNLTIYKDYQKTIPIETKTNLTEEQLKSYEFNLDDYSDNSRTITYVFKENKLNQQYYFYSSIIKD